MGFMKELQGFIHNLTTEDHYASYEDFERETQMAQGQGGQLLAPNNQGISMINNRSSASIHNTGGPSGPVQYNPGMRSSQANDSGIPMQEYVDGRASLPSMTEIWDRLDRWLEREFPELGDDMQEGVTANDLNAFEKDLGISLPLDVRDSYKIRDGQLSLGKTRGLIYSYVMLDLESMAGESAVWRKVYDRLEKKSNMFLQGQSRESAGSASFQQQKIVHSKFLSHQRSIPQGAVQELYCHPSWIPFVKDNVGNNIAIDLAPGPTGKWGQIILFGRDYDTKVVVANSFTEFMLSLCEDLEDGKFEIDEIEETINYFDKGRYYEYFTVLKMRAYAAHREDVERQRQEELEEQQKARKQKVRPVSRQASSSQAKTKAKKAESKPILPKETLISPEVKKVEKEEKPTNDSFVIDDDEDEEKEVEKKLAEVKIDEKKEKPEVKAEVKPEVKEAVKPEVKEEAKEEVREEVKEEPKEPNTEAKVPEPAV